MMTIRLIGTYTASYKVKVSPDLTQVVNLVSIKIYDTYDNIFVLIIIFIVIWSDDQLLKSTWLISVLEIVLQCCVSFFVVVVILFEDTVHSTMQKTKWWCVMQRLKEKKCKCKVKWIWSEEVWEKRWWCWWNFFLTHTRFCTCHWLAYFCYWIYEVSAWGTGYAGFGFYKNIYFWSIYTIATSLYKNELIGNEKNFRTNTAKKVLRKNDE